MNIDLEAICLELHESLAIVKNVEREIREARGTVAVSIKDKLTKVLDGNCGFSTICRIGDILSSDKAILNGDDPTLECSDLTLFKYAPITSFDFERSFSRFKAVLSDNQRRFLVENVRMHVVIYCNAAMNGTGK